MSVFQRILTIPQRIIPLKSLHILRNLVVCDNLLTKQFYGKMSSEKPRIVFVLGAPGAGKGTQCEKIVNEFGYVHLSAGDLLRAERNRPDSEFAELIETSIKQGKIVPVAVTCSLLENAMNASIAADSNKHKFLIDGFPRNQDNLDGWNKQMQAKVNLKFVLVFDCTEVVCIERCLNRDSGRTDDNIESLKKRFDVFYHDSLPIIDYYDGQGIVRKIDGISPPELVFEEVKKAFGDFNAK